MKYLLQILRLIVKHPFVLFKHINIHNIKTLLNALKNEPPQQIFVNFKNLLTPTPISTLHKEENSILGKVDELISFEDKIEIKGWALSSNEIEKIEIYQLVGEAELGLERLDVASVYTNHEYRHQSGFRFKGLTSNESEQYLAKVYNKDIGTSKFFNVPVTANLSSKGLTEQYELYQSIQQTNKIDIEDLKRQAKLLPYRPKISIVIPVYNISPRYLKKCILSVTNQIYDNWELCLYDDASTNEYTVKYLKKWLNKDSRIKVGFGKKNQHISGATNEAIKLTTGEFIGLLDNDDKLSVDALYEVAKVINEQPDIDFIYSDEDIITQDGRPIAPHFKPDFSADVLLSNNYITHFSVIRKSHGDRIGWFRKGYEGAQDHDLILRATETTTKIYHIPKVLYHWRSIAGSTASEIGEKDYATQNGIKAVKDSLRRNKLKGKVGKGFGPGVYKIDYDVKSDSLVSILIWAVDETLATVLNFINHIISATIYPKSTLVLFTADTVVIEKIEHFKDVIIIDVSNKVGRKTEILDEYIAQTNIAYFMLLSPWIEIHQEGWLEVLLGQIKRPGIGIVGTMLIRGDDTIYQTGIILGVGSGIDYAHQEISCKEYGYFNRIHLLQNYSAIGQECFLFKKSVWSEIGGFDVEKLDQFFEVDFCLRAKQKEYRTIYTPQTKLKYHGPTLNKLYDLDSYWNSIAILKKKWRAYFEQDPFYNPNFYQANARYNLNIPLKNDEAYYIYDNCEKVFINNGKLTVEGWTFSSKGIAKIEVWNGNHLLGEAKKGFERLDVSNIYPNFHFAKKSGYRYEGIHPKLNNNAEGIKLKIYDRFGKDKVIQKSITKINAPLLVQEKYQIFIENQLLDALSEKEIKQQITLFKYQPKISIVTPVYNVAPEYLDKCFESLIRQYYENWEFCLHDDASTNQRTISCLKEWRERDERIKISFGKENQHISGATNDAIKLASGEFVGLLDNDDELTPDALFEVVKVLNENDELDFIYSDEDKLELDGTRCDVHFKPDFNLDFFLSTNYLCHFSVIRKVLGDKVGWFRKGYEGSQDYDLFIRVIEQTISKRIYHIPKVLYHWRKIPGSTAAVYSDKGYAAQASAKSLSDYLNRNKIKGKVEKGLFPGYYRIVRDITHDKLVSIIIPFKDEVEILKKCIDSVFEKTKYSNFEILLISNNSQKITTFKYLEYIVSEYTNVFVYEYNIPFNYSKINNWAVKKTKGEYILLLNNDTEVINEGWLSSMVEHISREEVGAVGAKLLYPDNTIQHAGVILKISGVAGHIHKGLPDGLPGYFGRAATTQNLSACTAACLLIKKRLYKEVAGLDEENLRVAFNDIDLCLKIRALDYLIVYTPFAKLYHYESKTRGEEHSDPDKMKRFLGEIKFFQEKWATYFENGDEYYNPNLTLEALDFSIKI